MSELLCDTDENYSGTENESSAIDYQLFPINWPCLALDISVSIVLLICVTLFMLETHELFCLSSVLSHKEFNNVNEGVYLLLVFSAILNQMIFFRRNRNRFFREKFDNFPILIIQYFYVILELCFYIFNFILIFTECKFSISRFVKETSEMVFMLIILPFATMSSTNNVRHLNVWLKFRTKIILILAMIGCLLVSLKKVFFNIKNDYNKQNNKNITSDCNQSWEIKNINGFIKSIISPLIVIDINFFIIAFILLVNPMRKADINNEIIEILNDDDDYNDNNEFSQSYERFSILSWISLVRFRIVTVLLSFFSISALLVSLLISSRSTQFTGMYEIYLDLFSIQCLIGSFYGIFYYFVELKTWLNIDNRNLKSDQYFNYLGTLASLFFTAIMLINLFGRAIHDHKENNIVTAQIVNYICQTTQLLIQGPCIDSASCKAIKKFTNAETDSWSFKIFPALFLASFNLIAMIINVYYTQYPFFLNISHLYESSDYMWLILTNLVLPLTILHRFHGMTVFIHLTIKQWQ